MVLFMSSTDDSQSRMEMTVSAINRHPLASYPENETTYSPGASKACCVRILFACSLSPKSQLGSNTNGCGKSVNCIGVSIQKGELGNNCSRNNIHIGIRSQDIKRQTIRYSIARVERGKFCPNTARTRIGVHAGTNEYASYF